MKLATVRALANLAMAEVPEVVAAAYKGEGLRFGRDYLIPKPFDPRLIEMIAPAVAKAAADTGVARRPIVDMEAYRQKLGRFVYHSGNAMQPVFSVAKGSGKCLLLAEGEDERVLRAAQVIVDEKLAKPLLLGLPSIIVDRIKAIGLRLKPGTDCELIDPHAEAYTECAEVYHARRKRDGVSAALALSEKRSNATVFASILLERGFGDAMLCGVIGRTADHLTSIRNVIGTRDGVRTLAVMQMLILQQHRYSSATRTAIPIRLPSRSPTSRCWRRPKSGDLASRREWRCCRIRASEAPHSQTRRRCGRRERSFTSDRPIWPWRVRCATMLRCRGRCSTRVSRFRLRGTSQCAGDAKSRRRQYLLQSVAHGGRPGTHGRRHSARGAAKPAQILMPSSTRREDGWLMVNLIIGGYHRQAAVEQTSNRCGRQWCRKTGACYPVWQHTQAPGKTNAALMN
jgi:hypothetical protein